jgi:hypothetical protein
MSLVYHAVRHFLYRKSQEEEIGYCALHPRSAQSPPLTLRGLRLLPKRATDPTDRHPAFGRRFGLQAYHARQGRIATASPPHLLQPTQQLVRFVPRSLPHLPLSARWNPTSPAEQLYHFSCLARQKKSTHEGMDLLFISKFARLQSNP